jgi:hypothetical protein
MLDEIFPPHYFTLFLSIRNGNFKKNNDILVKQLNNMNITDLVSFKKMMITAVEECKVLDENYSDFYFDPVCDIFTLNKYEHVEDLIYILNKEQRLIIHNKYKKVSEQLKQLCNEQLKELS